MRPRDILAENLKTLMARTPGLSRFPEIEKASKGELVNGTLDRIRRAAVATTIDRLAVIAEVFGVEPWQLLVQGLNPEALPELSTTPVLEQIRSLVAAERPALSHSADGINPAVSHAQQKGRNTSGRGLKTGSTLDKVTVVNHKGGTDAKRSSDEAVQKSGSRRDTPGNARARRRG